MRANLMGIIADAWAKTDLEGCFQWASSLANLNEKSSALTGAILSVIQDGKTDEAVKLIGRVPAGEVRDDMVVYGLSGIAETDVDAALKVARALSGRGAIEAASRTLAAKLIDGDNLADLATLMGDLPHGTLRESLSVAIVEEMSRSNPELAMVWFRENPGYSGAAQVRKIAAGFAIKNPARGMSLASQIENPRERQEFLNSLGAAWGRKDPAAAGEWLLENTKAGDYEKNKAAYSGIVSEWLQWEHEGVFKKIALVEDEKARTGLTLQAAAALANFDPQLAAEKIGEVTDKNSKESIAAMTTLATRWLEKDPIEATRWVNEMAEGPAKDAAASEIVVNILNVDRDTDAARRWAETIKSEEQRKLALGRVAELERKNGLQR